MKGPWGRIQTDCRRVWKCPACGAQRLLPATITSVVCQCSGREGSNRGSSGQGSHDSPRWMILEEASLRKLRPIVEFDPHAPRGPQFLEDADPHRISQPGVVQPRTVPKGPKPPYQGTGASSRQPSAPVAPQAPAPAAKSEDQTPSRNAAGLRETHEDENVPEVNPQQPAADRSADRRAHESRSSQKRRGVEEIPGSQNQELLEPDLHHESEPQPALPPDVPEIKTASAAREARRKSPHQEPRSSTGLSPTISRPASASRVSSAPESNDDFAAGLDLSETSDSPQTSSRPVHQSRPQTPAHQPADDKKRSETKPAKMPQPDDEAFGEGLIS
ncbi:hypothetical protein Plim_3938 [Planctopirus limnophila DSM 3776]|uniref:Uncharacterized protein n=1 Tax=Planctopirus limnophila (strain ATCC 43296 / DSM 3776 / IFAM 1008 / Mu 290) TaxID=521674 RepID=D5SXC7_PLAL2|nr:hypothetical protein [Planctopirus limnophila]ADG69749.1 hypothetical protein Plim_3938 [Planctopirus limnophila DSM 3776]